MKILETALQLVYIFKFVVLLVNMRLCCTFTPPFPCGGLKPSPHLFSISATKNKHACKHAAALCCAAADLITFKKLITRCFTMIQAKVAILSLMCLLNDIFQNSLKMLTWWEKNYCRFVLWHSYILCYRFIHSFV